jgi:STAM-binding protein
LLSFGIFRLTDPPGLEAILHCTATEAFHPHPDLPIYTVSRRLRCFPPRVMLNRRQDADKGHVHMKDVSLEIVDLR